jgi:ketol-acid reductoisomerase
MADEETREAFRENIEEIQSGRFAREWTMEQQADFPVFNRLWSRMRDHEINDVEEEAWEKLDFELE